MAQQIKKRKMSFMELAQLEIFSDEIAAVNFAFEMDLIHRDAQCDFCSHLLEIRKHDSFRMKHAFYCPNCQLYTSIFNKSFFTRTKLPINQVIHLIYNWSMKLGVEITARQVGTTEKTVSNFFQCLRDACEEWYKIHSARKIGGPGTTVEIDETLMTKRKYNRGRLPNDVWVIGGICRETKEIFIKEIPDRTRDTLERVIKKHVLLGTQINTDMWPAYDNLNNLGYIHKTVNHSTNFVNPVDGTHTQNIERLWRDLKDVKKRYQGIPESEIESHVYEFLWRKSCSVTYKNAFEEALNMLSEIEWN